MSKPRVPNDGFPYFVRARDPLHRLLALLGIKRWVITETGRAELIKLAGRIDELREVAERERKGDEPPDG